MAKTHVSTTINGDEVEFLCDSEQTLLDVLRDELHMNGTKEGCATGDCGPAVSLSTAVWFAHVWCLARKSKASLCPPSKAWLKALNCIRCSASSLSTPRFNVASARQGFWSLRSHCLKNTLIQPKHKFGTG